MGNKLVIGVVVGALIAGAPSVLPNVGRADAQVSVCTCSAAFDAINSDLQFVSRYYNQATLAASPAQCGSACDAWRRNWFYKDACDHPTRINRGARASWGFDSGRNETFIGPDTWWCPMPPP
jgi:hypothetical protein